MLWGWCGHYGAGCAALRAPYSLPHFYTYHDTYRLTTVSRRCTSMTAARMDTTLVCRGVALCPP